LTVHLEHCASSVDGGECDCAQRYIELIRREAASLAETLRNASDAGVSHALILPQLILVFREAFGEMPPNMMQALTQVTEQAQ
jgi:hypothetical protein